MTGRRKLALIAGIYVVEGFPMGVFSDVWPVFLRDAGLSLSQIAALSGLGVAWSLKALWSPAVDRYGERQHWIAGPLVALALVLLCVPEVAESAWLPALSALIALFCVASATQDVAIDAYAVALIERGEEGPLNAARVTAYRFGAFSFGAGALFIAERAGWRAAHTAMAALILLFAAAVLATPRRTVPLEQRRAWRAAFRSWLRPDLAGALGFLLCFRMSDLAIAPMLKPFWRDAGFSLDEIAAVSTGWGALAGIGGAIAGAALVARRPLARALAIAAGASIASNLGYAAAAALGAGRVPVYAASTFESFASGVAGVAFMSLLVRSCDRSHAAVQYAALTALMRIPGTGLGMASGALSEALGYAGCFALTGLATLPAFAFLRSAVRFSDVAGRSR